MSLRHFVPYPDKGSRAVSVERLGYNTKAKSRHTVVKADLGGITGGAGRCGCILLTVHRTGARPFNNGNDSIKHRLASGKHGRTGTITGKLTTFGVIPAHVTYSDTAHTHRAYSHVLGIFNSSPGISCQRDLCRNNIRSIFSRLTRAGRGRRALLILNRRPAVSVTYR